MSVPFSLCWTKPTHPLLPQLKYCPAKFKVTVPVAPANLPVPPTLVTVKVPSNGKGGPELLSHSVPETRF